jgi:hypothetical protein
MMSTSNTIKEWSVALRRWPLPIVIPMKAGIHRSVARTAEKWVPAFARKTETPRNPPDSGAPFAGDSVSSAVSPDAPTGDRETIEPGQIADRIKTGLAARIKDAYQRAVHGEAEWIAGTLDLASALWAARAQFSANQEFHQWLIEQECDFLSRDDRASLIGLGKHRKLAEKMLAKTKSRSWDLIWRSMQEQIHPEPRVRSAPKTEAESGAAQPTEIVYVVQIKDLLEHEGCIVCMNEHTARSFIDEYLSGTKSWWEIYTEPLSNFDLTDCELRDDQWRGAEDGDEYPKRIAAEDKNLFDHDDPDEVLDDEEVYDEPVADDANASEPEPIVAPGRVWFVAEIAGDYESLPHLTEKSARDYIEECCEHAGERLSWAIFTEPETNFELENWTRIASEGRVRFDYAVAGYESQSQRIKRLADLEARPRRNREVEPEVVVAPDRVFFVNMHGTSAEVGDTQEYCIVYRTEEGARGYIEDFCEGAGEKAPWELFTEPATNFTFDDESREWTRIALEGRVRFDFYEPEPAQPRAPPRITELLIKKTALQPEPKVEPEPKIEPQVRPDFARDLIYRFSPLFLPNDTYHDPTRGTHPEGGFHHALPPDRRSFSEIKEGLDFLDWNDAVTWIFGNLPWEAELNRVLAQHCYEVADHVVLLGPIGVLFAEAKDRNYRAAGHGLVEHFEVPWERAFVNTKQGSALIVAHWRRGAPDLLPLWK